MIVACFLNIKQTTEHEDIVGRWLKNLCCKLDIRKVCIFSTNDKCME